MHGITELMQSRKKCLLFVIRLLRIEETLRVKKEDEVGDDDDDNDDDDGKTGSVRREGSKE